MAIIDCPECNQQVSNKAVNCPHCGYVLKEIKKRRLPIFLIVAIVAAFIAMNTPVMFYAIPLLILIGGSLISIIRTEPGWGISIFTLLFGGYLFLVPSIDQVKEDNYKSNIEVVSMGLEFEGNYRYDHAYVKNNGDKTIRYFRVEAYYKDSAGNVIDTDYTNSADYLEPGMRTEIRFIHKDDIDISSVELRLTEVTLE